MCLPITVKDPALIKVVKEALNVLKGQDSFNINKRIFFYQTDNCF